jgi:hypothetical protein
MEEFRHIRLIRLEIKWLENVSERLYSKSERNPLTSFGDKTHKRAERQLSPQIWRNNAPVCRQEPPLHQSFTPSYGANDRNSLSDK